jgi:hypothetical protein
MTQLKIDPEMTQLTIDPEATHRAENGCHRYCRSVFQPMYRGTLQAINPKAGCNNMSCMQSKGDDHCEVITWIGRDRE